MIGDFYTQKNPINKHNALMVNIGGGYLKFYNNTISAGTIVFEDHYVDAYWKLI